MTRTVTLDSMQEFKKFLETRTDEGEIISVTIERKDVDERFHVGIDDPKEKDVGDAHGG